MSAQSKPIFCRSKFDLEAWKSEVPGASPLPVVGSSSLQSTLGATRWPGATVAMACWVVCGDCVVPLVSRIAGWDEVWDVYGVVGDGGGEGER